MSRLLKNFSKSFNGFRLFEKLKREKSKIRRPLKILLVENQMNIYRFKTSTEYNRSMLRFYNDDPLFKNNKSGIFNIVCNPKGIYYANSIQYMLGVENEGNIVCQCVLLKHNAYDALMVAFFEAKEHAVDAVSFMLSVAKKYGKTLGCSKLIISLDGHCNYSVGFIRNTEKKYPLFGESYNPIFYHNFFENYKKVELTSFFDTLDNVQIEVEKLFTIIKNRATEIEFEFANFNKHGFENTIARYTDICNAAFKNHRYYFYRTYKENIELFKGMRLLFKSFNLIFAKKGKEDIGFILYYPNYNELVSPLKAASLKTLILFMMNKRKISTIKIEEIAVIPAYQSTTTILLLFKEALAQIRANYSWINKLVSSWILDENKKSYDLTSRFAKGHYKKYIVYEQEL